MSIAPPLRLDSVIARELILGGQKSGKSRIAEGRALRWLSTPGREAVLIATAIPGDAEMTARIARHRADRAERVPGLTTIEEPAALASALAARTAPHRLVIIDCLTLWLTQRMMPLGGSPVGPPDLRADIDALLVEVRTAQGPVIMVSNELGLGVSPASVESRAFVDALGTFHQSVAALCERVTLMVAGCELTVRGGRV
jgi:adenosylcobinamide kinase / adenosylcobinamide-phosphate guanylyltransferase